MNDDQVDGQPDDTDALVEFAQAVTRPSLWEAIHTRVADQLATAKHHPDNTGAFGEWSAAHTGWLRDYAARAVEDPAWFATQDRQTQRAVNTWRNREHRLNRTNQAGDQA